MLWNRLGNHVPRRHHCHLISKEGKRVCQALREEALPDFFLKFGLVVSMVDDVNSFKRQMKMSGGDVGENGWWRKKRGQEEDKYLYKAGKSGLAKPNYLLEKQRAREDRGYMVRNGISVIAVATSHYDAGSPWVRPMEILFVGP